MFRSFISCVYILHELFGVMVNVGPVTRLQQLEHKSRAPEYSSKAPFPLWAATDSFWRSAILNIQAMILPVYMHPCSVMCGD